MTAFALRALEATFLVSGPDADLERRLSQAFRGLAWNGSTGHALTVGDPGDPGGQIGLALDGRPVGSASTFEDLVDGVLGVLNRAAIEESGRYLLLHASSVELDRQAVVLPAPSGSGKSTLAAELVAGGFGYVADEIVAIDTATGRVVPYPKPLVLQGPAGGPEVRVLDPAEDPAPRPIAVIVSPKFGPIPGPLERLGRAEALVLLAENAFNFHDHGAVALRLLAQVVRGCDTYTVDVAAGVGLVAPIRSLLDGPGCRP